MSEIQGLRVENAELREQVDILTQALAEAMVICAKWSPGGIDDLTAMLATPSSATPARVAQGDLG